LVEWRSKEPYGIDTQVLTSSFKTEKALTKDPVPVNVDAMLFWKITDLEKGCFGCRILSERDQSGLADSPS